ncbi:nitronate monooxygenase [Brevundimonas bullata]|uniref:Nitronate monooxygenase n=1 Tax=Brevundimonas bullata TaxID=13160 RepID=A0A7W7IRL3_9CAUL|nr:nitronate monooxygenase [Brevundimonas bullata]MBB4799255.1 nitronate monooxygenase [Brevundimonas bullata]MBB6384051.1 nitronate monooxygenase [Brevundimonas bullata]
MTTAFPHPMRLPVIAAPMFLVSGPELVIAACKAGIGGAFPTPNCRTVADLDAWMGQITDALSPGDGPWVANLITHSTNARLAEDLALVAQYKPPIVITALGSPKPVMETVKAYGGLVFADVVNMALAKKAADAGVDGLACISAGAGGHTGHLSPFAFVSAVREFFDGWLTIGGGIADGAGVAGAVAAGADMVYMGTRFLAAAESRAQDPYKQMIVDCGPDDLIVSSAITGTPASWLKPSLRAAGMDPDALGGPITRDYSGDAAHKRWRDIWAAGQGLQKVGAVEPTAVVVDRLEAEYRAAATRFAGLTAPRSTAA